MEPYEELQLEVPEECVGTVIEQLGMRNATMESMNNFGNQVRLIYTIPSRGLIGFSTNFMTLTKGYGIMSHSFKEYRKYRIFILAKENWVFLFQWKMEKLPLML